MKSAAGANVSLTRELQIYVARKLKSGRYQTAGEVVREALRLLEQRDRLQEAHLAELRRDANVGIRDLQEGRFREFDRKGLKKLADEVKARGRQRLADRPKRRGA